MELVTSSDVGVLHFNPRHIAIQTLIEYHSIAIPSISLFDGQSLDSLWGHCTCVCVCVREREREREGGREGRTVREKEGKGEGDRVYFIQTPSTKFKGGNR